MSIIDPGFATLLLYFVQRCFYKAQDLYCNALRCVTKEYCHKQGVSNLYFYVLLLYKSSSSCHFIQSKFGTQAQKFDSLSCNMLLHRPLFLMGVEKLICWLFVVGLQVFVTLLYAIGIDTNAPLIHTCHINEQGLEMLWICSRIIIPNECCSL